jgi:hypothetical protein
VFDNGGDVSEETAIWRIKADSIERTVALVAASTAIETDLAAILDPGSPVADKMHKLYDDAPRPTGHWPYPSLANLTGESLQRRHGISSGGGPAPQMQYRSVTASVAPSAVVSVVSPQALVNDMVSLLPSSGPPAKLVVTVPPLGKQQPALP